MPKAKGAKNPPTKVRPPNPKVAKTARAARRGKFETEEQRKHRCDKMNKRVERLFSDTVGLVNKEDVSFVLFIRYNDGTEFVNKSLYNLQDEDLQRSVTGVAAAKAGEMFLRTAPDKVCFSLRLNAVS